MLSLHLGPDAAAQDELPGLVEAIRLLQRPLHGLTLLLGFADRSLHTHEPQRSEMVLSLDQSTVANMTAALEYLCKQIPPESDSHESRKAIADAMLAGAKAGARSLPQLQEIGSAKLKEIAQPKKRRWFWWR
jgi:hypothetical protein